jgi:hypothetical protein
LNLACARFKVHFGGAALRGLLPMLVDPIEEKGNALPFPGSVLFVFLTMLVLAQALLAYKDQFLTVTQMHSRGVEHGLPFVWHFAMWSDLLLITPLAAYIISRYQKQWRICWLIGSVVIGFSVSAGLHYLYTFSAIPEAHIQNHELTPAGFVHFVYMAITFAVFFLFFVTPNPTHKMLAVVSVLLLLHIFVGTHMLLGILSRYIPQDWYSGDPLKSIAGWATIASAAVGLLWRNIYEIDRLENWIKIEAYPSKHSWLKKVIAAFEFWSLQRFDTAERFLKALDYIASYVGVSAFTTVFVAKVQLSTELNGGISHLENWLLFIKSTALPCFLILLFGTIYMLGRHSVRLELAIGNKLFPPDRIPKDWGTPKVRVIAVVTVIAHLILFLSLTWFADNIVMASLIMLISAINDWRTRYLIGDGIKKYFEDEKYAPTPQDKDCAIIMERRTVADRFLKKPHLLKETARAIGCALAFTLALYGYLNETTEFNVAAYIVLIATLVINEIITMDWRIRMFFEMKAIDDRKSTMDTHHSVSGFR